MGKREELNLFLQRADEYIESKYILADVRIMNLLKSIACSETLLALFKNCLADFNYEEAKKKYLVKSPYLSEEKGEFIIPQSSRDLIAFTFNILVDIDAKKIDLAEFISKYFYVDGSFASGYNAFLNCMIKPFKNSVNTLMESVLDGKLQDPIEALIEEEKRKEKEREEEKVRQEKEKELLQKTYGETVKLIREVLVLDKQNLGAKKIEDALKEQMLLIIDMFANTLTSEDKDAIIYAHTAYKFMAKAHPFIFHSNAKKIEKLLKDVIDAI